MTKRFRYRRPAATLRPCVRRRRCLQPAAWVRAAAKPWKTSLGYQRRQMSKLRARVAFLEAALQREAGQS